MLKKIFITAFVLFLISSGISQAADKEISFAFTNWEPVIYGNDKGETKGLFKEILDEAFVKELKMKVLYNKRPWARAQREVEVGKSDLMITIATNERLSYAEKCADPIFLLYLNVFTYRGHQKLKDIRQIKTVDDIKNMSLVVASNLGNGWTKENIEQKGGRVSYVSNDHNFARFIAAERADIMIDSLISMNHHIKKLGLASKIVPTEARFGPLDFHLLISKKSKYLEFFPEINEAIAKIRREGILERIVSKYTKLN